MSPKRLLLIGASTLALVNGSVFGTLYIHKLLSGPTPEEIAAMKEAEERAKMDAVYAKLPPLEPFKSKAKYVRSIGEAINICEKKLHSEVDGRKSWEVNMIESNYVREKELYKIFMEYETPAKKKRAKKVFDVECEVSAEKRNIASWLVIPKY